jgi:sugar phosphate isomerase/epimerase
MMQRRDFLATAMIGTAAATSSSLYAANADPVPGDQRKKAKLRFCSQFGIIPGDNDDAKLKWMKQNGFEAFEIGRQGDDYLDWKKKADDVGLRISSLCIGSFGNKLTDEDPEKRKQGFDELKVQLERAGALGCNGVVYVPATGKPDRPNWRIRELTIEMLKELGPFAAEHKTNIILEPLRRGEAWFLRQVGDAAQIAKDAGVRGVAVLGDTYHMYTEEPDDMAAFIAGGEYVKHVHLGNGTKRRLPGQDNHSHVNAMRGLKYIGYSEFISFECGVDGDKAVEVPKSLDYLRKCWDEA